MQLLDAKYQSLSRYISSLPDELDAWVDYIQTHSRAEDQVSI